MMPKVAAGSHSLRIEDILRRSIVGRILLTPVDQLERYALRGLGLLVAVGSAATCFAVFAGFSEDKTLSDATELTLILGIVLALLATGHWRSRRSVARQEQRALPAWPFVPWLVIKSDPISLDTVSTTMTGAKEVDDGNEQAEADSWQ